MTVACGQGMQVMRCMIKFLGLHDELLRHELDIVEFHEKNYLFLMKSEADLRRRPIFCVNYREYCEFRTKSTKSETA